MIDNISFDLHSIELKYDKIKLFNKTIVNYYGLCTIMINTPVLKKYFECIGTEFTYNSWNYMKDMNDNSLDLLDLQQNHFCFIKTTRSRTPMIEHHRLAYKSNVVIIGTLDHNTITIELIKNRHGNNWTREFNILEEKLNILFPESNESETK